MTAQVLSIPPLVERDAVKINPGFDAIDPGESDCRRPIVCPNCHLPSVVIEQVETPVRGLCCVQLACHEYGCGWSHEGHYTDLELEIYGKDVQAITDLVEYDLRWGETAEPRQDLAEIIDHQQAGVTRLAA